MYFKNMDVSRILEHLVLSPVWGLDFFFLEKFLVISKHFYCSSLEILTSFMLFSFLNLSQKAKHDAPFLLCNNVPQVLILVGAVCQNTLTTLLVFSIKWNIRLPLPFCKDKK